MEFDAAVRLLLTAVVVVDVVLGLAVASQVEDLSGGVERWHSCEWVLRGGLKRLLRFVECVI